MTIKKNFDRDPVARKPKARGTNTRQDARIKHALRHGDFESLHDEDLDEMWWVPPEEDSEE